MSLGALRLARCTLAKSQKRCIESCRTISLSSHPAFFRGCKIFIQLGMTTGSRRSAGHNFLGSTYLSRLLFSALLARTYTKKKSILYSLFEEWYKDLDDCYRNGIDISGVPGIQRLYPVVLACKGDWPALAKAGRLCRHYLRDAPAAEFPPGICHLCRAGQAGFPWNAFESNSAWMCGDNPLPWTTPSPLSGLAQDKLNPASFFVIDTFHVCHKGIVADYVASAAATLSDYQLLGASKDFTKHMQVLYDEARTWCAGRHEYLHMTGLTKDVLGLDTMADYPVGCLCMFQRWFKGADTPLLAKFLQYRYCRALADCDEADEPVFRTIHAGLKHINGFMRAIYEQPLWVEPNDAANIAQMGLGFMRALNLAAKQ
ncbi:unnamed protein product, partial [Symbiodinium microadriaticum]